MKPRVYLFASMILLLILTACGQEETTPTLTATATGTRAPTIVVATPTERPEATLSPTPGQANVVDRLLDAEMATIRIVAQGEYRQPPAEAQQIPHGSGSGFIIDPSGIAVTTHNVVAGADDLKVWIGDDMTRAYDARVIGLAECENLALIEIDGDGFSYFEWSPDPPQDGFVAYVAGVPSNEQGFAILKGNVTSAEEDGDTVLSSIDQVFTYDTLVEPGHTGGAVLNAEGKLIGVHQSLCGEQDIPCGTPVDIAADAVEILLDGGGSSELGINGQAVVLERPSVSGIYVSSVNPESPAFAGIKPGDVIAELDGQPLAEDGTMSTYCDFVRGLPDDAVVDAQIWRLNTGAILEGNLNLDQLAVVRTLTPGEGGFQLSLEGLDINASQPGEVYYETDFGDGLDYWENFLLNGDPQDVDISTATGVFSITISGPQTYSYYIFNPNDLLDVADVVLETRATNKGANTNNVSLICRSSSVGWYEFNVTGGGLYFINRFDGITGEFVQLATGGSFDINLGQRTNDITARCVGDQLTLIVNDKELRTVQDDILSSGYIGLSISSFNNYPVVIEISEFRASVPELESE